MSENCLFCKIIKGEIPSKKIYNIIQRGRRKCLTKISIRKMVMQTGMIT